MNNINLGYNYEHGIGVEKDVHKAFIYYQESAEMGHANGTFSVGYCYHYGIGVDKDEHKAFIYYQKSAEMGHVGGTDNVGYCYEYGFGVEKDENKAFIYYQKSAEMGNANGTFNAGHCYQNGIGVEKDENKAFIYYQKSAEMGNANGAYVVGFCYHNGIVVEKDENKAFIYYQKSAEMGNANGTYWVGSCYHNGIGVEKDENKAFIYYQKSAEMGNANGTYMVGYCNDNGFGTKMIKRKAFEYYLRSAKLGSNEGKTAIKNKYNLSWISYDEFNNKKQIGKGGFATVYYAQWDNQNQKSGKDVALKILHGLKNEQEFIKELKLYVDIGAENPAFLKCYGISQEETTKDHILVLEYAEMGSLRKNLHTISQIKWEDKLCLLQCIAYDLKTIHSLKLIHRDLHSGNILQEDINSAYITDLGLSVSCIALQSDEIKGVMPYVAPEVLLEKVFTQKSDIYSLGVIMSEISTGQRAFDGYDFDTKLAVKICKGLQPEIAFGTPECYIKLAKQCMDSDPQKRPNASDIYIKTRDWLDKLGSSNFVNEIKKQFLDADKVIKPLPISKHSDEMYTSKMINTKLISNAIKGTE